MENGSELNLPEEPPEGSEEKPPEEPKVKPPEGPEEKPTPQQEIRCPHCGSMIVPKVIKTPTGGERWTCPECTKLISKPKERPPGEKKESVYREEVDPNEILRSILEKHPDLSGKHIEETMDWAQFGPIPPYLVTQLLGGMKDVKRHTAELIGHKYQMALQMSQGGGKPSFPPMMGMPQQQGEFNIPWPTPQMQQPPPYGFYQPPHQGYVPVNPNARGSSLSREEVIEIVRARDKDKELEEAKEKLKAHEKGEGTSNKERGLTAEDIVHIMDERDERGKDEKEKNVFIQTLDGIRQGLDNIHGRVSTIEQGGVPGKHSEGEEADWNKKILDAAGNKLIGLLEKGELTEDRVRSIAKELTPKPSAPPGTRSEYDMRVEQAQHEADARKIEAQEKTKGYEAIAGGIRDGFGSMGWNIGAGASGGTPKESSSVPQTRTETPATENQPMEWKDGFWHTKCVYTDCRASMAFEDGKSTVLCPSCHRVIQVQPTEEELKQKVSAEKSKTPKIKAEAKKEEPKREEPQREEKPAATLAPIGAKVEKVKPPKTEKLETVKKPTEEEERGGECDS